MISGSSSIILIYEHIQLQKLNAEESFPDRPRSHFTLTVKALQEHERQTATEVRQFNCPNCKRSRWWRVVPRNKPVSRCKRCHVRCDALPRNEEYGVGQFICPVYSCGEVFYKTCGAIDTRDCPHCGKSVAQPCIHPAYKTHGPISYLKQLKFTPKSVAHISTGSTVETWPSQTALDTRPPPPRPIYIVRRWDEREVNRDSSLHGSRASSCGCAVVANKAYVDQVATNRDSSLHGSRASSCGRTSSCGSQGSRRSGRN